MSPEVNGCNDAAIRAKEAVGTHFRIVIIALIAYSMKGDCDRCLAAGMDAFVTKTTRAFELFDATENICNTTFH